MKPYQAVVVEGDPEPGVLIVEVLTMEPDCDARPIAKGATAPEWLTSDRASARAPGLPALLDKAREKADWPLLEPVAFSTSSRSAAVFEIPWRRVIFCRVPAAPHPA